MTVYEAILARRTIRRFTNQPIPFELLERCVNAARLAPSAANRQRLQYIVVSHPALRNKVFAAVKWAGHLKPAWAPDSGERPTAYIVMLADGRIEGHQAYDVGAAAENILLTALEAGLGSCCLGSARKQQVAKVLCIPDSHEIALVIALGFPSEQARTIDFAGSIKYWRDTSDVLMVPKKSLNEILYYDRYGRRSPSLTGSR